MGQLINEWGWTADAKSWIDHAIRAHPGLPFSAAKVEKPAGGGRRRDLVLLDTAGRSVLTGEIKLPYEKDGTSPYLESVIRDAWEKARSARAPYFFTWNVNQFVLWETFADATPRRDRSYRLYEVLPGRPVSREEHLLHAETEQAIEAWLDGFLREFASIVNGKTALEQKAPDKGFVEALESALRLPILFTYDTLAERYGDTVFRSRLDAWMRDAQGWLLFDDAASIRGNLERAAKFSCYVLVNKLVFYEVLRKRHPAELPSLSVPEHIETSDAFRQQLEWHFQAAKRVTGDYETVFGESHLEIGNLIPFYAEAAVPHWCQ